MRRKNSPTPQQVELVKLRWAQEVLIKAIAQETGLKESAVESVRVREGLPSRHAGRKKYVAVRMPEPVLNAARQKASENNLSLSYYVARLVKKDLGFHVG